MWRFIHLSDPHLGSQIDGKWNNRFTCTMMPDVIGCLRRDLAELDPDFILATGDIASQQTRDAMFAARDLMDSLGFPYYPMGGNHDFMVEDSRQWFLEAFDARLPVRDTVYSVTHKDLHFCVLDAWWKWSDGGLCPFRENDANQTMDHTLEDEWAVPPHQFAWLEDDLRRHHGTPTVVAVHYPAVPIPARMRRPNMMDAGTLSNGALLIEFLQRYPQVKVIMSGHVHMHFIETQGRITQVVTASLPEYPVEYRDIHVYEDRLELYTRGLSDTSFARRSLIDGNEWTAGEESDRAATISLR